MKFVSFVPLKLKSQRLPGKTLKLLGDKPLCYYIFKTLLSIMEDVYVFCSDESIMDHLPTGVQFLQRDASLDRDETLGLEIYQSFASKVESDVYVLAHATSPLTRIETVQSGLQAIKEGYDSAFTVQKFQTFAWHNHKPINYDLNLIPRTQDLSPVYIETSGLFIFKKEVLEKNRRIGDNPFLIEVDGFEGVDIDTIKEFNLAAILIDQLKMVSSPVQC